MKNQFPYPGSPITVTQEMCDKNRHMNVSYYAKIFDDCAWSLCREMGFTSEYFDAGFSCFTMETNIKYLNELLCGETAYPFYRLIDVGPKLMHVGGVLMTEDGRVAATNEQMWLHIDMSIRKSAVMPPTILEGLHALREKHDEAGEIPFSLRLGIQSK